jgi:nucleoside-diphosphate-sugar epimerase
VPSNQTPLGALPSRFRRERVLIVGCGDVGLRVAVPLMRRARVLALTSTPERQAFLRSQGVVPIVGDLDDPASLRRLAGLSTRVLHLAPPPGEGVHDPRTHALLTALSRRTPPRSLVYGSTTGVYGDCQGAWVRESRPVAPFTRRAFRRVDAEDAVRHWGRRWTGDTRAQILRIPGIYAPDREGGTPRQRLLRGTPVLQREDDVFTNHIHADDLARACDLALWRTRAQRVVQVCDDTDLRMGDYYDLAADLYQLPRPPRVPRQSAENALPLMLLSFMSESRRLDNTRMRRELRLRLRYPTVREGLVVP